MPIPQTSDAPPAPRRLLRDVVYDKLFVAIMDGTVELGERLNDDELVAWLGVSRTPVREAIAKLADQAIVDIEANRYTRIVAPTMAEFVDTVEIGYQVWALSAERATLALTDQQLETVLGVLDARIAAFEKREPEDAVALDSMNELLLKAAGSPSLVRLSLASGPRLLLLVRRAFAAGFFPWDAALTFSRALRQAFADRDAAEVGRLVRTQPESWTEFFSDVEASGLYPVESRRP